MLQSDVIAKLRSSYGFSDIAAYPDATLIDLIQSALNKISEYYPLIERSSLSTVAGQTRYTVSKTGLFGIKEVFYSADSGGSSGSIESNSTFRNSSNFVRIMDMEIAAHLQPSGAEIVSYDTFDLIPTPEEVITVYYDYKKIRALTDLPDIFEDDVYAIALNTFAMEKFRKATASNGMGGNPYKFDRRGNITEDAANTVSETKKTITTDLADIVKSIQMKVMKL